MKILASFILATILLIKSDKTIQEPKKVYIQSVENKIQIGSLSKNRNLTFGFKNILLENLQELNYEITDSLSNFDLMVVLIEPVNVFNEPVLISIESTLFLVPNVVVAILELKSLVVVATDEDKLPIEELNPLVVVAIELDKEPIDDVKDELTLVMVLVNPLVVVATDELKLLILELKSLVVVATDDDKLPILELNPDVVVAILELNDVFPPNKELILVDTDELNDCKSIPSTLPVKSIEPLTIIVSPKTILVPPDEVILKPSCICVVPLIDIIPFVGSNNISPPPDDFNSISPSADCNIIESEPPSNILID